MGKAYLNRRRQVMAGLIAPTTGGLLLPALKLTRRKNGQVEDTGLAKPEKPRFWILLCILCFVFIPLESFVLLSWAGLGKASRSQSEANRPKWCLLSSRSQRLVHWPTAFPPEAAWADLHRAG